MFNSVKIGPQEFRIEFRHTRDDGMLNDSSYGYTIDQGNLIVIASDVSVSKQKVTLTHEILHAARMIFEGPTTPKKKSDYSDWEHHFIAVRENSLLMILRDNPDLTAWPLEDK